MNAAVEANNKVVCLHGSAPINLQNELVMANLARVSATVNDLNEQGVTVISVSISRISGTPDVQIDEPSTALIAAGVHYRTSGGVTGEEIMQARLHGCRVLWVARRLRA